MQWGNNPYGNSSSVQSPLLAFKNTLVKAKGKSSIERVNMTTDDPFFIIIQFASPKNVSALKPKDIPACGFQTGTGYQSCRGCNMSNISSVAVTYTCTDKSFLLCPPVAAVSNRRRTLELEVTYSHLFEEVKKRMFFLRILTIVFIIHIFHPL